jgi:superfamily II DNA/RNA helicase
LSTKVLEAVTAAGYTTPTPIQAAAIPVAVTGRDVLGIAQTGTGKTASFVLPMLTRLEQGRARARMPRSLIIAPTRELAAQVAEHFGRFGGTHKLTVALLIGGVSFDDQNRKLDRGADVLIATPGRLLDHFQRGKLLMTGVEILVIDEADRMLDMGFIPDIERICSLLPPSRQTLFFSATMPPEIQRLVDRFLKSPERIEVARQATAANTITQRFCKAPADPKLKRAVLRELIRSQNVKNAIIFCNRKRDVAILHRSLLRHGLNAGALHGDMDQHQRTATLDAFRAGQITLLAASDVAARGLDIPDVSHVFNYDVPVHAEDYVHRIGRTGRAGKEGFSATLVTPLDSKMMRIMEKMIGIEPEWLTGIEVPADAHSDGGGEQRYGRGDRDRDRGRGRDRDRRHGDRKEPRPDAPIEAPREMAAAAQSQPEEAGFGEARVSRRSDRDRRPRRGREGSKEQRPAAQEERASDRGHPREREPRESHRGRHGAAQPHQRGHHQQGHRGRHREEPAVLGLGDHVPEFLKRSVKI